MKALFVDFNGRKSAKDLEALAMLAATFGLTTVVAEPEAPKPKPRAKRTPKPKPEPEPTEPKPEPTEPKPVAKVAEPDNTRLNDNESKPEPKPKPRRGGGRSFPKLPTQKWKITDCLFVGMVVSRKPKIVKGEEVLDKDGKPVIVVKHLAIAGVELDDKTGNVRLAFIDKDCENATTNAKWFVDPKTVLDRAEPTIENATLIMDYYG